MGSADTRVLLASNAGYGFVARLEHLVAKNRAGKAMLNVPKGGLALPPYLIGATDDAVVVALTNEGRMLAFRLIELPELTKGKGNKVINVPATAFKTGAETMIACVVMTPAEDLLVYAGQRHLRLKAKDVEHYIGERARRGRKLPRGFQKVDGLEVVA
ncbi:MAG: hypothetical protein HC809_04690 [Gammaproteobacteria bacterium]|nr:hypothetical protein [Gammaproteobacteria bacterium]